MDIEQEIFDKLKDDGYSVQNLDITVERLLEDSNFMMPKDHAEELYTKMPTAVARKFKDGNSKEDRETPSINFFGHQKKLELTIDVSQDMSPLLSKMEFDSSITAVESKPVKTLSYKEMYNMYIKFDMSIRDIISTGDN